MIKGVIFQCYEERNGKQLCIEQAFIPDKDAPIKRVDFNDNPICIPFSVKDGQEVDFPIVLNQPE